MKQHPNQNNPWHRRLLKDLEFTCNAFLLSSFLTISRCRDLHSCNATLRRGNLSAFSVYLSVCSSVTVSQSSVNMVQRMLFPSSKGWHRSDSTYRMHLLKYIGNYAPSLSLSIPCIYIRLEKGSGIDCIKSTIFPSQIVGGSGLGRYENAEAAVSAGLLRVEVKSSRMACG